MLETKPKHYATKPVLLKAIKLEVETVPAMQLETEDRQDLDTKLDNAEHIALWCDGEANWSYDKLLMERVVTVQVEDVRGDTQIAYAGDWVVQHVGGNFSVYTNEEFEKAGFHEFDLASFDKPHTCSYCLSNPRKTPMGDPEEKLCPECGVRYSGPRRTIEYQALKAAGLVADD